MSFPSNAVLLRTVGLLCIGLTAMAQDQQPPNVQLLPPEQLDGLVSPIALYADPLIAQVLAASTYPLEVVEANRWLQANPNLRGTELTDAARDQSWDPSVQALVVFPSVIQMMDRNLRWTTDLGNAFLAQEQDVMDAIQRQRQSASQSGRLVSNDQQRVEFEDNRNVISIQPSQPDVIYVPVYDPVSIWGPPVYSPYPAFWYPPRPSYGSVIAVGGFGFFLGVGVANQFHYWGGWNSWGWHPGWRDRTVIINNNFYARNNYRPPNNYLRNGNSVWEHNPQHRAGVPYPNRNVADRVGGGFSRDRNYSRPAASQPNRDIRPNVQPDRQAEHQPHPGPQPDRSRDRSAFGSVGNGERTRIESDRGYSSLGNRGGNSRQAAPQANPQSNPQPRVERREQPRSAGRSEQQRQAPASRQGNQPQPNPQSNAQPRVERREQPRPEGRSEQQRQAAPASRQGRESGREK